MTIRSSWLQAVQAGMQRFAAGIDVSSQDVRLVVVSRRVRASASLQIEYMRTVALPANAMAGIEIADRQALARALRDAFAGLPHLCATSALRCAMAVPASATVMATLPLARLAAQSGCAEDGGHELGELEPAVMSEVERIAGLERHALAVDWFVDERPTPVRSVTIAATGRQHLEARIECAAAAGISLTAIDGEPHAALRAMRYAAARELDPHEPYVALWIGADGVQGWRLVDDSIAAEMRYPAPEHSDLADALRDLLQGPQFDCALVSGELHLLEGVGFSIADIADVLGCTVLPFECAALGGISRQVSDPLLHEPAAAVAFGLALRGVLE
ncbi:pilus assembly protein PilM [bacterium M00.F.Ca.ET.228.01.1.1]|uniref:pilus assembly protein PilM n=1 Tax=Paraburkholderia phenoliruptrix TaxID=252970 RepID=UPI001091D0B5|nr:pilus assembly protein PilM [Paraburkholderia phenoliruptrix]TGP40851.1 pilus assembly protein PilM [bacterium M00.F.Ca.ET.228.01.1.1]TGR97167.1 pilus assembly protein PilM [bacterium M00.F.Ca.ET.191.01.1.1]TGU01680.1 pilus assembly protein PilM [bacterium M00.F.Ca.ET.155.01.1.1]MBW0449718.1 pilus assembly protein PilM [Paraburkholderia phenoliruptrix]MBW9100823.1 pilus assembly protein PilM [Paraburkholderia phenoliruptrix]